ncbi:MAG: hypothetical protein IJ257_03530 [Treponema sp.]|nr:hypothetical protein [Treponema sp.]
MTSTLVQSSFFSLIKRMLFAVALVLCAAGAWGATYTWTDGGAAQNHYWSNENNWSPNGIPGAGDNVYFTGESTVNVEINQDVEIADLHLNSVEEGTVRFTFSPNALYSGSEYSLTCDNFYFYYDKDGNGNETEILYGKISCNTFETKCINDDSITDRIIHSGDEYIYYFNLSGNAVFEIKEKSLNLYSNNGDFQLSFNNGTVYLPFSGDMVDYLDYEYDVSGEGEQWLSFSKTTFKQYAGEPTYYKIEEGTSRQNFYLSRYSSTSGNVVYYKYKVTAFTGTEATDDTGSFYIYDEESDANDSDPTGLFLGKEGRLMLDNSSRSKLFWIDDGDALADGDSITLTIYTPDTRFILGTFTYTYTEDPVVTDFNTYYWTGADSTSWTNSANWAYKGLLGATEKYVSVAEYDGGSYDGRYPGYEDGDTAVFDSGESADNLTLNGSGYSLTLVNSSGSSSNRATIRGYGDNAESANITVDGYFLFDSIAVGSLATNENSKIQVTKFSSINDRECSYALAGLYIDTSFNLDSSSQFTSSDSVDNEKPTLFVGGNMTNAGAVYVNNISDVIFNGGYSGAGMLAVSAGKVTFGANTANTVEILDISDSASITNNSTNPVILKSVACGTKSPVFTGNFKASGAFTPSKTATYFINGDMDFSGVSGGAVPPNAKLYFYNTSTDSSDTRTFTTPSVNFYIPTFYFGGYVNLALNGQLTVDNMYRGASRDDYKLTAGTASTISGSGSLTVSDILDVSRMNKTDDASIIGTLVFDAKVKADKLAVHSGTILKVNEGKTLSVDTYSTYGTTNAPPLNLNIDGTLSVTSSLSAIPACDSTITIGTSGLLNSTGGTISAKKIINSGTINLTGTSSSLAFTTYEGASDFSDKVKSAGGSITSSDAENNGTIGNLEINSATTSIGYASDIADTNVFKLGSLTIGSDSDTSAVLQAQSNLSLSNGFWLNYSGESGFKANEHSVEFLTSTMFDGETVFYDFICEAAGAELSFANGKKQTVTNDFIVTGSDGSEITIQSDTSGEEFYIDVAVGKETVSYAWVTDSSSTNDSIIARNSVDMGNNTNWNFSDFSYTWTGEDSTSPTDWHKKANWNPKSIPGSLSYAVIPDGLSNYPSVNSAAAVTNLTVGSDSAASHTANLLLPAALTDATLSVTGTLKNYATIEYGGSARITDGAATPTPINDTESGGTVKYSGSGQTITDFGTTDYANLLISGSAATETTGTLFVGGNLTVGASGSLSLKNDLSLAGNFSLEATGSFTSDSGKTLSFNGNVSAAQTITVADGGVVQFYNVEIASSASVSTASSFETAGNWTNNGVFSASGGTISFSGTSATVSGSNIFYGVEAKTAGSTISFADENLFNSLLFSGSGMTVKFAAGKTQTVNSSFSASGVALTTDSSSPSESEQSTWWILEMPNYDGSDHDSSFPTFENTTVSYSKANQTVAHAWASTVSEGARDSTENWFLTTFYWIGSADSSWTNAANWAYDEAGAKTAGHYPSFVRGGNEIFIATADGGNPPSLPFTDPLTSAEVSSLSFKRLTVNDGKVLDIKGLTVSASDGEEATADFVNNGRLKLYGQSGQISSSVENGAYSTVEYYADNAADFESLAWGNNYINLVFGTNMTGEVSDELVVSGRTEILNGSGNSLSLSGINQFTGDVSIGKSPSSSAGDIALNSDGNLSMGEVYCDSLEVRSSVKFTENVASAVTFTGENAQINANGKTFEKNVTFSGKGAFLSGDNTFSSTAKFTADTSLSGNNTFASFACESGGVKLSFGSGTTQTVSDSLTLKGSQNSLIEFWGADEWSILPLFDVSDVSKISVAYTRITNSKNENSEPIIVYAKDGYNVDGTGNTNWFFAGQKYLWTGSDSASPHEWNEKSNWNPASVPTKYSDVEILSLDSENYPILSAPVDLANDTADFNFDADGDGFNESVGSSVTIGENVVFDFNGYNLTANTLSNQGRIKVSGNEVFVKNGDSGITNFPIDANGFITGVIEYYGDFSPALNWGKKFSQLEFTEGATGSVPDELSVSGMTLIANGSGNVITLSGENTFSGLVTVGTETLPGGDITLSGDDTYNTFESGIALVSSGITTLKGKNADGGAFSVIGDADVSSLTVESDVIFEGSLVSDGDITISGSSSFNGNVTSSGNQSYTGAVTLNSDSGIIFDAGTAGEVTFSSSVTGTSGSSLTLASPAHLHGDVTSTAPQSYKASVNLYGTRILDAGESDILFNAGVSGDASVTLKSPAHFEAENPITASAGENITFESSVSANTDLALSAVETLSFKGAVETDSNLSLTASSASFASTASFSQNGEKTLTLETGTVLAVSTAGFEAGNLVISAGSSFIQTGVNDSDSPQTVSSIENNGVCFWDAGSEGGTLTLAGSISGDFAAEVVFNKKNVTVTGNPITISGVFYDLKIPEGIKTTNGDGIAVRRNFTVEGDYIHNGKKLTLGGVSLSDGSHFPSANNDDGSAGEIAVANPTVSQLGSVTVSQETTGKSFVTDIVADSVIMSDTTAGGGRIEFVKKLTAKTVENSENTDFDISIDSACTVTEPVIFGTSGILTLGTGEESACTFTASLTHTKGDTKIAGAVSVSSLDFSNTELLAKTSLDCAKATFAGSVSGDYDFIIRGNPEFKAAVTLSSIDVTGETTVSALGGLELPLSVLTSLTQKYTGKLSLESATVFKAQKSDGTFSDITFTSIIGSANADGSISASTITLLSGDYDLQSSLTAHASEKILVSAGLDGKLSAVSGIDFSDSELYFDFAAFTMSLEHDLKAQNLYFFNGSFDLKADAALESGNFALFGANYNADDPRYPSSDTRFAYFGYENLVYQPNQGLESLSAKLSTDSSSKITLTGNLYLNGLDLNNAHFILPDNSASNPVFNATASVSEKEWGLPYAVLFNASVANSSAASSSGSAFVAASRSQNVTDASGNSGFQFEVPQIAEAYSVSDSVICLSFDMNLENSGSEVEKTVAFASSVLSGGIFYNNAAIAFDGIFYTESDGTTCSVPLSESSWKDKDIPAATKLYLKVSSSEKTWNTDATARSAGGEDSTDRSGSHRSVTTDLSLMEGLFYAAEGKTMCRNYGTALWKDESVSGSDYALPESYATIDKARPVLVDVFAGQELFSKNTGSADSQKFYDSHNFIELRYSEPVDIGSLVSGDENDNQNIQAEDSFDSVSEHGGAIINKNSGLEIKGFVSIEEGELTAGWRDSSSHEIDTAKPHALYRKFQRTASGNEEIQKNRIRIAVAGYVDEDNPVKISSSEFHNWIGYIDSSQTPSGHVTVTENDFITDLALDADGNASPNKLDENNSSRSISVNDRASASADSLHTGWDCLHPVFTPYITSLDGEDRYSWTSGDSKDRVYEIIGTVDSNTSAYLDRVELHLFDNQQNYESSDTYKWISQNGWSKNGSLLTNHLAPENAGGNRSFSNGANMTKGGIRRSSLTDASQAFQYVYVIDGVKSEIRDFEENIVSQNVKSSLFRNKDITVTETENDSPYISLLLNKEDDELPIRTSFILTYTAEKSFITDLAGNRLLQTDDDVNTKTLYSMDITPPSFSIVLSPLGHDKLYAVFTKPLAFGEDLLPDSGSLTEILEKMAENIEFVYSEDDSVDTTKTVDSISVEKVELADYSEDYTALLFTLSRRVTLDDVEKIWLRVNDVGVEGESFSGTSIRSYFRDINGNAIPYHTCHAISDFALNAVNVLYARSASDDEGWEEQGLYGSDVVPLSSDYAVHDFSREGGNYAKIRSGHDIVFQMQFVGGTDESGEYLPVQNGESLALVMDIKSNLRTDWISDKFNLLTGNDWRIWLDARMNSLASDYNTSPLSGNPVFEDVSGSEILKNMTASNEEYKFSNKKEFNFFFKILDSNGSVIEVNHDGDKTTSRIPLYAFRMPTELISSGKFSFADLWSFTISDITPQRGGVSILNNVINASIGEKAALQVEVKNEGSLNIYVMTLDGNIVKRLEKGRVSAGTHYYYWDGKNNAGSPVARGLYFVRVSGSGLDETRKVMVIKN